MTQEQIPLAMFIAACCGALAGLFALRSNAACAWALLAAIILNILGCAGYGFSVNIRNGGTFTVTQIFAGILLSLPGFLIFLGLPACGGCLVTALLCRFVRRKSSER